MECDSVHSNIEKALQNTTVNLPSDHIQIIQSARKSKHGKYRVKYIDFTFFKEPPPMYTAIKYKHLQEIKETIPKEAHYFYDNLDHHGEWCWDIPIF